MRIDQLLDGAIQEALQSQTSTSEGISGELLTPEVGTSDQSDTASLLERDAGSGDSSELTLSAAIGPFQEVAIDEEGLDEEDEEGEGEKKDLEMIRSARTMAQEINCANAACASPPSKHRRPRPPPNPWACWKAWPMSTCSAPIFSMAWPLAWACSICSTGLGRSATAKNRLGNGLAEHGQELTPCFGPVLDQHRWWQRSVGGS